MTIVHFVLAHLVNGFLRAQCQSDHIDVHLSVQVGSI